MSFDTFIDYQARLRPDAPAIVSPSGGFSFAELNAMVARFAGALAPLGLSSRSIVAVDFRNPVTHWVILLALARLGVASACAQDTDVSFRITDQPSAAENVFVASDAWIETVSKNPPAPTPRVRRDERAPGRVLLSSGTTGLQKRISLSWQVIDQNNLIAPIAYGPLRAGPWLLEAAIGTRMGFMITLAAWTTGHAVLLRGSADLAGVLTRFAPVLVGMVPVQLQYTLDHLPETFAPLTATRLIVAGGLVSPALAQAARRRLTPDIRVFYATSECGIMTIGDSNLLDRHEGAVGYALPDVTIEIVDEAGQVVEAGRSGEVRVRSERFGDPVPSAESPILREGWFCPGDLGRLLPDGLLLLDGRIDEVMNIGGVKVMPGYIEDKLRACPGVADLAAFTLPDRERVAQWCLAVVVAAGSDQNAIVEDLKHRLPSLPMAYLVFVSAIPRNAMGKIERAKLGALARAHIAAAG